MTVAIVRDSELVRQALGTGDLSVTDPATGYHRQLYASCPSCGQPAHPARVTRGADRTITQVTMRCASCSEEFVPSSAAMYLR